MDIFKLIFHHDLLVEQLEGADQNRTIAKASLSLEDFMKPMPTYSRFYLSGTALEKEAFALSSLTAFSDVKLALSSVFSGNRFFYKNTLFTHLWELIESLPMNTGLIASEKLELDYSCSLEGKEYVREYGPEIRTVLEKGDTVILKVAASHGFDIQIFAIKNWYSALFYALKTVLSPNFRLFSINGKKLSSDRLYYFETYRLQDPPHGFEEVFVDTVY